MRSLLAVLAVVVIALGVYGLRHFREESAKATAARAEAKAEQSETAECKARLAKFYQAIQRYRKAHRNNLPPSPEALIPRYLPSADLMFCPTAARWRSQGKTFAQGSLLIGGKSYPETYGFQWLTAGYGRLVKINGERAPLITCEAHREGMYRAVYHKPPPLGAFDPDERKKLFHDVAESPLIAVRANGDVGSVTADEL